MTWAPHPLPAQLQHRGGDVGPELLAIVEDAIANHPRSLQKRIGPSEIGNPCARRIGYTLLEAPTFNPRVNWKAFVGTAMHEKLEAVLDAHNLNLAFTDPAWPAGEERFYVEQRVSAGEIADQVIDGSTDVYDRVTCTVIDWKLVGPTKIRDYKRNGPGSQYRIQVHAYGRGWIRRGLPVDRVMIAFLPRNGELRDSVLWSEPYDEQVAVDGFTRANGIAATTTAMGVRALPVLPTADAYCTHCDYFKHASTDLTQGCPGHPGALDPAPPALTIAGKP